jgi:hypothetical protein
MIYIFTGQGCLLIEQIALKASPWSSVEVVDINGSGLLPYFPHKEFVINVRADHPASLRIEIAIQERDVWNIRRVALKSQSDIARTMGMWH